MAKITIVGTSHIAEESAKRVRETIEREKPDCVAIELCPARYYALSQQQKPRYNRKQGLFYFLLASLQRLLAQQTGILPGTEMLSAVEVAKAVNAKIVLIDKDILEIVEGLKRIPLKEKLKLLTGFFAVPFSLPAKKDLQKIPEEKIVKQAMSYMKRELPLLYRLLVADRNLFMAQWIKKLQKQHKKIIVVVGLGHKQGLERLLKSKKAKK